MNDLDERIAAARDRLRSRSPGKHAADGHETEISGTQGWIGKGFRIGIEMVSALIVGVGLGLLIDSTFDSSPWGLVVMFFLGAGAGMVNVYRAVSGMGMAVGYRRREEKETTSGKAPSEAPPDEE